MKKDPIRFNKSYFADAPNKMLHSNKATDITIAYVNYCNPGMLDWDFAWGTRFFLYFLRPHQKNICNLVI